MQFFCSPSNQPSVPILASQFHCLFWCLFFSVFFFYFPNYFCCFVVFGLPLIDCFCNIGLCQALGPNGMNNHNGLWEHLNISSRLAYCNCNVFYAIQIEVFYKVGLCFLC